MLGIAACVGIFAFVNFDSNPTFLSIFSEEEHEFFNWISKFDKAYLSKKVFKERFENFKNNCKKIKEYSKELVNGTFTIGINHFADWSDEEYKHILGYKSDSNYTNTRPTLSAPV